jgi:hypothetical protein
VSGRLPPEVIQRIVRQSFDRLRLCYENGLRNAPKLMGRVVVRFVIGRDGAVTDAVDDGSDLPSSGVVACVTRAFYGLSFPQPEGGIVTVRYPIFFSPAEAADAGAAYPQEAPAPAPESLAPSATAAAADANPPPLTCAPVHLAGQPCLARGMCADGLACRDHECSSDPPTAAGGACKGEDDCGPGLYCRRPKGVCVARKPEGAACSSSLQCGGLCLDEKCTAFCGAR